MRFAAIALAWCALALPALPTLAVDLVPAPAGIERQAGKLYLPTPLGIDVSAPALEQARAIPHAIDLSFANPMIRPRLPCIRPFDMLCPSTSSCASVSFRRKPVLHQVASSVLAEGLHVG